MDLKHPQEEKKRFCVRATTTPSFADIVKRNPCLRFPDTSSSSSALYRHVSFPFVTPYNSNKRILLQQYNQVGPFWKKEEEEEEEDREENFFYVYADIPFHDWAQTEGINPVTKMLTSSFDKYCYRKSERKELEDHVHQFLINTKATPPTAKIKSLPPKEELGVPRSLQKKKKRKRAPKAPFDTRYTSTSLMDYRDETTLTSNKAGATCIAEDERLEDYYARTFTFKLVKDCDDTACCIYCCSECAKVNNAFGGCLNMIPLDRIMIYIYNHSCFKDRYRNYHL